MKNNKQTIESQLHCKATAELEGSVIEDLLKTDGSLKDLLDDRSSQDNQDNSDRSPEQLQQ